MQERVRNYHPQLTTAKTYEVERFCHFEHRRAQSALFMTDEKIYRTVKVQINEHLGRKWRLARGRGAGAYADLRLA